MIKYLLLMFLLLCSCSAREDSLFTGTPEKPLSGPTEAAQLNRDEFFSIHQEEKVFKNRYLKSILKLQSLNFADERDLNLLYLLELLGPIEDNSFVVRSLDYLKKESEGRNFDRLALKKSKDEFYNLKYTMIFAYRKLLEQGLSKKDALSSVKEKLLNIYDGLLTIEGISFSQIIDSFFTQIDDNSIPTSSEQKELISRLAEIKLAQMKTERDIFLELLESEEIALLSYVKLIKPPTVSIEKIETRELSNFKARTKLSLLSGEVETGPIINFKSQSKITLSSVLIDQSKKYFACELELTATPILKSKTVIVTSALYKDSISVRVESFTGLIEVTKAWNQEEMIDDCKKNYFNIVETSLTKALLIKAGEMVFQGRHSQCEEAADCRRWGATKTKIEKGSSIACQAIGKSYKRKSCVIVGGEGSPCRVIEEDALISSGLGEVRCGKDLLCKRDSKTQWFTNNTIKIKPSGSCQRKIDNIL